MSIIHDYAIDVDVERYPAETLINGRVQKAVPDIIPIKASLQPVSQGNVKQLLGEGFESREAIMVYSDSPLRTSNEKNKTSADVLIYNNGRYEIKSVENWSYQMTDLPHYKAIALLIEGESGG